MNLKFATHFRPAPEHGGVSRDESSTGPRALLISILLLAIADYRMMLRHGMVSGDSWLAPSDKLKYNGLTVSKKGVFSVTNGVSSGCDSIHGGSIQMRETLAFFSGRHLDRVCAFIGICPDRVRSRMSLLHRTEKGSRP